MIVFSSGENRGLQLFIGVPFTGAGILIIILALQGDPSVSHLPSPMNLLGGVLFLGTGLWGLQIHRLWARGSEDLWNMLWMAVICCLFGIFIVVAAFVDDEANFNAPRWVVGAAGSVFLVAGVYIGKTQAIDKGIVQPNSLMNLLLTAMLITGFGAVATWVSLGPGEREFSGSISIPGVAFGLPANELIGRLCFMPGALVLDACAVVVWFQIVKRLLQK
jgi:hypothetical protein